MPSVNAFISLGYGLYGILVIVGMALLTYNKKKQEKGEIFITAEFRLIRFSISVVNKLIEYILGMAFMIDNRMKTQNFEMIYLTTGNCQSSGVVHYIYKKVVHS